MEPMERRLRRTQDRDLALQLFLASQQRKLGARALTVTDERGRIIAGVGEIEEGSGQVWVATWELQIGGESLVVSSFGGKMSYEVGNGVRRIRSALPSPVADARPT
jgi:hypothetical protein